ncbi:MAG TPA: metallophosphoesterase [Acidobacteriota bacterium]|nr:metallophosphoesterase [Acidobacteriota bacterium]
MTVPYRQITGPYRRTIVVGDIHGCWDEFRRLMELAGFGEGDALVTVGDFLDRGPGSWEIGRFLRETSNAFSVIGNHERRVAGVVRGTSRPAWSQKQSLSMIPEAEHADWAAWLESLPAVIETPHAIITHARLDPARPLTDQDAYHTAAVGGASVTIDIEGDGVPVWFRRMRFEKPVCMGHIGYERVTLVSAGLYALDTGAVRGGQLTAVVFPGGDIVQVPVSRNYHDEAYKAWRAAQRALVGDPLSWTLSQALSVLNTQEDDATDWAAELGVLNRAIDELGIQERGRRMQARLRERFGDVPPPGPVRGEYFKTVKSALPDWGSRNLAVRLLKNAPLTFQDLAVAFPDARVKDMAAVAASLEDEIVSRRDAGAQRDV